MLANPDAWEFVTFDNPEDAPGSFHRLPELA
jgi:UDP-3-O-[3-hydroxymyristoyl] N-acetylglucosamine deacetylase